MIKKTSKRNLNSNKNKSDDLLFEENRNEEHIKGKNRKIKINYETERKLVINQI